MKQTRDGSFVPWRSPSGLVDMRGLTVTLVLYAIGIALLISASKIAGAVVVLAGSAVAAYIGVTAARRIKRRNANR